MIGVIKNTSVETVTIQQTAGRQTPKPSSGAFGEVLRQGAMVLLGAAGGVTSVLPGGGIVSAAVRAGTASAAASSPVTTLPSTGEDPRSPSPGPDTSSQLPSGSGIDEMWAIQEAGMRSNLEVLRLQEQIGRENRVFSTLSNVMKARHETARTAIGNIR